MSAVLQMPQLDEVLVSDAVAEAVATDTPTLDVLRRRSGLDPLGLSLALAALFHYRHLDTAVLAGAAPAFDLLGPGECARKGCVLVRECGATIAVITDPFNAELRMWLEARVVAQFDWALAALPDVTAFLARHEKSVRAIDAALQSANTRTAGSHLLEDLSLASISGDESPVVKLVHSTIYDALRAGASDIHIESAPNGLAIRYRIDGVLVAIASVDGVEVAEQVISRIKVMSELDIAERRVPQDGRFKVAIDGRAIDFRVSIIPSVHGEDAVVRILDKQAITDQMQGLRLDGLGFDDRTVDGLRRLSLRPHGMLLVTGPTGSGKTTTLYAALSETNSGSDKIVTIEDPVEYQLPGVLQIPVNEKKGLTFARGLRSILRHDPDKIMVGEIRDPETAQIAIQSALTGHLVFTTVHANNVFDVLSRFTHMGVDPYSFVSALNGILAQRLIRILCLQCAEPERMSNEKLAESGIRMAGVSQFKFMTARGCMHCRGSGYRGRKAIGELLVLNDELREAIIARAPVRQLKELAEKSGARLIRRAAVELVVRGQTSLEEVNRVTSLA